MRKVTMQTVADALNISRVSVWKVMNNQPGVSDTLRSTILATAEELGYFNTKARPSAAPIFKAGASMPTVSVVVSRPDSATFWMKIIHRIAEDLTEQGYNLLYTYLPAEYTPGYTLPLNLSNGSIDGIIVLNVYNPEMLELIASTGTPTVFLDAAPGISIDKLRGDLLLLEGRHTLRQITESLIVNGSRRIGFIGDIHYSMTNEERYAGYQNAIKSYGLTDEPEICMTRSLGITNYKKEVQEFLNSIDRMPDAFVCANDHIAKVVFDALSQKNYDVPGKLLLSGYDGDSDYFSNPKFLTTAVVDTQQLGCRLVNQLVYRVKYPDAPYEVSHILPRIHYGLSTEAKSFRKA